MKTAEAIYDEMADQFAQETGMELAGAGEMAVRLRALAAPALRATPPGRAGHDSGGHL